MCGGGGGGGGGALAGQLCIDARTEKNDEKGYFFTSWAVTPPPTSEKSQSYRFLSSYGPGPLN